VSKTKWPSGVPVFESKTVDGSFIAIAVDFVDSDWVDDGYVKFYDPTCDCDGFFCMQWPIEDVKPLNTDARAFLAIAKESK